ncbi:digestive cysteine proteinase 2-like [Diorhabda sublineata]|uniref:digestive cysteine proteinase 2-like n=1 Tax=Diorhabda sublineata TaxID=1163346 RepID=UPI0024E06CC8|nr:digestive cysteine proteinase 2-like [Diorhabda sublineata]
MISNLKLTLISLTYIVTTVCEASVPQWSESYSVRGVLYLPYAEIEEPFHAWYNGPNGNSRIDFYDGMAKTYQLGADDYGTGIKIVPFTTEEVSNEITCFLVNGTEEEPVKSQSILPSLDDFQLEGTEGEGESEMEIWSLTVQEMEKKNVYTMWVRYDSNNQPIPVKYDMKGYNTLLGSHYDHYYLEYDSYLIYQEGFPLGVFDVKFYECRSFPGPGNQHSHNINPMSEFIRPEKSEHVDHHFNEFIRAHNKQYSDVNEHVMRKDIFRQNFRFINSVNRQNRGYSLAVNHLADKTNEEMKILRGRIPNGGYNGGKPFPYKNVDSEDLPEQYDWRLYGAVTPVKDQAVCGSCWSFATVGHLEGALFLKKNNRTNLVRLSEQALVDCSWGYGNNGCDGGEDFRSYQWILKHGGIPLDSDYGAYIGQDGYCHADGLNKTASITGWVNVTVNDVNAHRLAIFKEGPISVSIDASQKTFRFYSNGVYYDENCANGADDLNHAVLAVGYGTMNGEDYWLIKNSWSTYWGNDGYILMSARDNNCGVMTQATYVTM